MKSKLYSKILTLSVVVLFIIIGLQPAIAVDSNQSIVSKTSKENCNCKEVDDRQFIILEKQLNSFEVYTKLLLILSRYNPEVKGEVQELSNAISTINEMYDKIETCLSYNEKPICEVLYNAHSKTYDIWDVLDELHDKFKDIKIIVQILEIIHYLTGVYGVIFVIIGTLFNCEWADEWPHPE